ncbi:sugar transferase [Calothrix sp. PCC 6303]|uniref:sugar transferase n=1 Tax=Calothrix sp. PCC 6303 TaxID=1170562 RepID=UPI0002A03A55|nr:sugar transferase [Calothrix sp. PCC 6303]AFY99519.1 sugar transferase [Calothrix sp. PCC 6303]
MPISLDDVALPKDFPPLVLIAFTRPDLLKEVLIGLSQQSLLPKKIIAFIDGARNAKDQPLIEQCIVLLKDFSLTIPVDIVARPNNLGCDQNVIIGLTEVLSAYDSLVYLEDDIVPNRHFYDRVCRLLEAYREHKQIFSISSYASFPEKIYKSIDTDFEVSDRVFGWGFGIWSDRWHDIALMDQPKQYNPFGSFYQIPTTLQTKMTMINQFWLEKNNQTDWMITMTLAALYKNRLHIVPTTSFVRNIGFGHPQAKTYSKGQEPSWVNSRYDDSACPKYLPVSCRELPNMLKASLKGTEVVNHLSSQAGLWLSPLAMLYLLRQYPDFKSAIALLRLFISRIPKMLQRLRTGLSI